MSAAMTWEQDLVQSPEEAAIRGGLVFTRAAGGALLLAGLVHGACLLQTALFARQSVPVVAVEVAFALLCVAHVWAGSRAYDGSPTFTGVGAAAAVGGAGIAALWFGWALLGGVVALLPLLATVMGGLVALVCAVALPMALKVTSARQRLLAD